MSLPSLYVRNKRKEKDPGRLRVNGKLPSVSKMPSLIWGERSRDKLKYHIYQLGNKCHQEIGLLEGGLK